ncbi:MAG: hypothetical protein ACOZE7_10945 [Pseudomonadota bacterium]
MRPFYAFRRQLLVAMTTSLMAMSAWADGSITFIHGGIGPVTNLPNANFTIDLINGATTQTFVNKTGQVILDVHFSWADNLTVRGYDDLPDQQTSLYFGSYTTAPKTLDFFDKQNGVGIDKDEKFEISISGFGDMTKVAVKLTFAGGKGATVINQAPMVPEPESAAMGLAGVMLVLGLRRRSARQH